jgi:hypothetical protein
VLECTGNANKLTSLIGHSPGNECLAAARRSVQQDTLGGLHTNSLEQLWMTQGKLHQFPAVTQHEGYNRYMQRKTTARNITRQEEERWTMENMVIMEGFPVSSKEDCPIGNDSEG